MGILTDFSVIFTLFIIYFHKKVKNKENLNENWAPRSNFHSFSFGEHGDF